MNYTVQCNFYVADPVSISIVPRRRLLPALCVAFVVLIAMAYSLFSRAAQPAAAYEQSPQFAGGKFRNAAPRHALGALKTLEVMWRFATGKPDDSVPRQPVPVYAVMRSDLLAAPDMSLWRLGHSTLLFKINGQFWLTDPVFSERASPFQFLGPKRFYAPPITIDELPPITGVILSHDHYDHLDYAAIQKLAPKVEHFITPLGVGDRLIAWGVPLSLAVLAFNIWGGASTGAAGWALFCVTSSVMGLAQPAVGMSFRAALAGRALSAYNLVIFAGVFFAQWSLGLLIDGFAALGLSPVVSFQAAMGVFLCCGMAAYAGFVGMKADNSPQ